jgi:hypothetical protein
MILSIILAASFLALNGQTANAQAPRTWVSGVGDDANPCSRTAPCKTFAGAISKTAPGGEIDALDPGGFGAVTITKSITIDGGGGQVASVLVAGTNGIVVSAAGATVTLRNLRINGLLGTPTPGLNGIQFLAGAALHVENCTIFGFSQTALNVNVSSASNIQVFVTDTVLSNSSVGLAARTSGAGRVSVAAHRTSFVQNSAVGFRLDATGGSGLMLGSISDSLIAGNGQGVTAVGSATASAGLRVTRSSIVNNVGAGAAVVTAGAPTAITFSQNLITSNTPGLSTTGGGLLVTHQNNNIIGNFPDGAFTTPAPPQ